MQVCWFKRDLRIHDHAPLAMSLLQASSRGAVLPVYIHEPSWWMQPDTSGQHIAFSRECLYELRKDLLSHGATLFDPVGEAVEVFEALWQKTRFTHLTSYQETGTLHTYERDRAVLAWCRFRGVAWEEMPQNGVHRGKIFKEKGFRFSDHLSQMLTQERPLPATGHWAPLPWYPENPEEVREDKPGRLRGGRAQALHLLEIFLSPSTLLAYPGAISSPNTAITGCSRLSPYLAFGVLSDGEVFRAVHSQYVRLKNQGDPVASQRLEEAVRFFLERLYWRAAYHQAFERNHTREHQVELAPFNGQREALLIPEWLDAWQQGKTGVPYIDAAMRMLAHTGWLNMRLRGTVASFALNELWLPWREVGLHLAREFLDYDAPIHWSQVQIHAGSAKACDPLTYNPKKQAQEHDPEGRFIHRWLPELSRVPLEHLTEPWLMSPAMQSKASCRIGVEYPAPPVNLKQAHDAARERVTALRQEKAPPPNRFWDQRERLRREISQISLFD